MGNSLSNNNAIAAALEALIILTNFQRRETKENRRDAEKGKKTKA
jgi:hypothetical protein